MTAVSLGAFFDCSGCAACAEDHHLLLIRFHIQIPECLHKAISICVVCDQFSVFDLNSIRASDLLHGIRKNIAIIQDLQFSRHRDIETDKPAVLFNGIHCFAQRINTRFDQNIIIGIHGKLGKRLPVDHRGKTVRDRASDQAGQMSCF